MAIVHKQVSWTGATREQLSQKLANSGAKVNVTWTSDTTANVLGEQAELTKYRDHLATQGIVFVILGDLPLPPAPPAPLPTPSGTPLDDSVWQDAWREIREEDRAAILTRVNTRYDNLGGTREP